MSSLNSKRPKNYISSEISQTRPGLNAIRTRLEAFLASSNERKRGLIRRFWALSVKDYELNRADYWFHYILEGEKCNTMLLMYGLIQLRLPTSVVLCRESVGTIIGCLQNEARDSVIEILSACMHMHLWSALVV